MKSRIASHLSIAFGLAVLLGATTSHATDPCVSDAKQEFTDARAQCKEDYQTAKDACLNRDHACVEGCRAGRAECAATTNLDEDLAVCRHALQDAKDACRANNAEGSPELDKCIDDAQVTAFLCRKDARRAAKPALNACRAGFRACGKACGPANPPVTAADVRQCKLDAKAAYLTCGKDSREAFQAQKDLCLNRDHACVEGCRAGRDACRQPFEDGLDSDIAACNAARKTQVDTVCDPQPEPDRTTCITAADVTAFQCRDQARENAKPNFQACSDGFKACAEGCPPAS